MDNSKIAKVVRASKQIMKKSASETKHCYFVGCNKPTIHAHSISNKHLLLKLSVDGYVAFIKKEASGNNFVELEETGRGKATTFRGFCEEHDKIFHPIDNADYEIGNAEQEFLFAMRASAKEFNARQTVNSATDKLLKDKEITGYSFGLEGNLNLDVLKMGYDMDVDDEKKRRSIFTDTYGKSKYNVIQTSTLVVNSELPVAVSSSFYLELAPDGSTVNAMADTSAKLKPWYLTLFPQNGKTYCIISYLRKDHNAFKFLDDIVTVSDTQKQIIISNLITSYTENLVANPTYWNNLPDETKNKYNTVFSTSFSATPQAFVADDTLNLFPNAKT